MIFDVIIIGAGLAGLSATKAVLENDKQISVALLEKDCVGSNVPSPLSFIEIIDEHGLSDCIKEKYSTFIFHNYNGSSVTYTLPYEYLIVLDYKKACLKKPAASPQQTRSEDTLHEQYLNTRAFV